MIVGFAVSILITEVIWADPYEWTAIINVAITVLGAFQYGKLSEAAASRARSMSGSTAKNEPTTTAVQPDDRGRQRELARRLPSGYDCHRHGGPHVHRADDREVVVEADGSGDDADDDEPVPAAVPGSGEDVELRHEAASERQAGEAEHEHPHRSAEQRPLPAQAADRLESRRPSELTLARGDDGEGAERRRAVGNEVEEQRGAARLVRRGQRE